MKKITKKLLCCMLSALLAFGAAIPAFAAEEADTTPVIVINDIDFNPIYNTEDGTKVFDFADLKYDILFTDGFSANITDMFTADFIEQVTTGGISILDLALLLLDNFGFGTDIMALAGKVLEVVTPLLGDLENIDITAILSEIDFKQYAEDIKNDMTATINNMKLLAMNDDGTPANENIGIYTYEESLEELYSIDAESAAAITGNIADKIADTVGYEYTYIYNYDWRLDPVENAAKLSDYIDTVLENSGAEKVSILSEGYGSVIATTYLAENDDAAEYVDNFVTVASEFLGTSVAGDFFKGDIVNELTSINRYSSAYIRYTNDISDNPMTAYLTWLINYILNNELEIQALCHKVKGVVSDIYDFAKYSEIIDKIAKMPGLWALVPTYDYDEALENIYGENEPAIIDMLDTFKDYQYDFESILVDAKDNGINVYIVASWDLQIMPIGENTDIQSDGVVDTEYASFGATCIDLNDVGDATKAVQCIDDGHTHMSRNYDMLSPLHAEAGICSYIDASTCALPENTWFIKNMKHGTFAYESNSTDFLVWLITSDTERTVWQKAEYKQFMSYNRYINPGILNSDGLVADNNSQPGGYLLGDVNLDGVVTSLDAMLAYDAVLGSYEIEEGSIPFANTDVDFDLELTDADAKKILEISAGLVPSMQSGIKFDYESENNTLEASDYEIELRPEYNSAKNQLELTLVVLDAKGSYNGNFVVKYDTEMFKFASSDASELKYGAAVAGGPEDVDGTLTYAYASYKAISAKDCDENCDLVIGTCYLTVSREIKATAITAGASYFYDDEELVYVEPIKIDLDEDFFFMLGDADNNRVISAADARTILRIAAKLEEATDDDMFRRCDVDCNGVITAQDARLALRASAKIQDKF